jgi:YesN/AraC family two-component response regulator
MCSPLQTTNNVVILYVEDDEISRKFLGLIIKRRYPGITLLSATNGKEGLDKFKLERPGLVISDIIMPEMDGIQMIKEIREISPDVGIIVTSASCDFETFTNVVDLDSRFFLCKPIDTNKLFDAIDEWLAGQVMIRENNCSALAW